MTTARDMIAEWFTKTGFTPEQADTWAGRMMDHFKAADESGRLELAGILNPWRPIETAPKDEDGPPALLWKSPEHVAVGWFVIPDSGNAGWAWPSPGQPTHWLPLPAPPSEDTPK